MMALAFFLLSGCISQVNKPQPELSVERNVDITLQQITAQQQTILQAIQQHCDCRKRKP